MLFPARHCEDLCMEPGGGEEEEGGVNLGGLSCLLAAQNTQHLKIQVHVLSVLEKNREDYFSDKKKLYF
jgi:hypothetical protein